MNPSYNQHFRKDRYARLSWALSLATGIILMLMLYGCCETDLTPTHRYEIELTFATGTKQIRAYEFPNGAFVQNTRFFGEDLTGWWYQPINSGVTCGMTYYLISSAAIDLDVISIQQLDKP